MADLSYGLPDQEDMANIVFAVWGFVGMISIGLCRVKVPQDTPMGKAEPVEAAIAWAMMLICWPLTVWNRAKFARYGDPRDEHNPSWLAEGQKTVSDM
jgi:hypothetical protein